MRNTEWNHLRAKLHHDWLQNRYLTFLMARAEYLDSIVDEGISVREDIFKQFGDWKNKEGDLLTLIGTTVDALSPAQFLDEYPLNGMAEDYKVWLKEVVDGLYLERTRMKEINRKLGEKFRSIAELFSLLSRMLMGLNSELKDKAGERPFQRFHKEIQELSRMISFLPHEVQVV